MASFWRASDGPRECRAEHVVAGELLGSCLELALLLRKLRCRENRNAAVAPGTADLLAKPAQDTPAQFLSVFLRKRVWEEVEAEPPVAVPDKRLRRLATHQCIHLSHQLVQGLDVTDDVRQVHGHYTHVLPGHQLDQEDLTSMPKSEAPIHGGTKGTLQRLEQADLGLQV